MCIEQGMQAQQEQQKQKQIAEMQNQAVQAPVHQEDYTARLLQRNGGQYAQDARTTYLEKTAHMQDTAQLGKKSFKSNTKEKKLRNERIDRAKLMTDRATAYTLDVYDQMKEVCENQQERKEARSRLAEQKAEFTKTVGKLSDDTTEQQAAFFWRMHDVQKHFYSPEMFLTSNIHVKKTFMEYLDRIEAYDELIEEYQRDQDAYADFAEDIEGLVTHLGPVIEALRHRLQVYCEQNRVTLNGEILDETAEGAHLGDNDVTDWFEKVRVFNQWKHHLNVSGGPLSDEERESFRRMREEAGRQENLQNRQDVKPWQRTREEATSTNSDLQEQASRQELRRLNRRLYEAGLKDVAKIVQEYVVGTRYVVGYTEERKRLKKAIKAVKVALDKETNTNVLQALTNIQNYFDQMTNGTLQIPADTPANRIMDFSETKLKEEGLDGAGSTRNSLIQVVSHWSDQTDTPLFSHEPTVNDLKQRLVSNCYMVASVAGLVELNPAKLKECIRENEGGTVTVRLYVPQNQLTGQPNQEIEAEDVDGFAVIGEEEINQANEDALLVPVYVTVKKEIPRIAGADALSAGALWMQMIEKACAYVGRNGMKGYKSLWYGEGGEFLQRLLGIEPELDYSKGITEPEAIEAMKDALFQNICTAREHNVIYHAGSSQRSVDGLNSGHAYSVLGGKVENGQKYVLLRNPYSTHSLQYDENGNRSMTGRLLSAGSDETYGQFYMKFEEFLDTFDKVTHTNLNNAPQN